MVNGLDLVNLLAIFTIMSKLTQKELARRVGVSPTAVSFVLADPDTPKVSSEKRQAILELAPQLKRRRKRSTSLKSIALLRPLYSRNPAINYFDRILNGILDEANRQGLRLIVESEAKRLLDLAAGGHVGGVVLGAPLSSAELGRLPRECYVVGVNTWELSEPNVILVDERAGAREAMDHFVESGHCRIGYWPMRSDFASPGHARERYGAYQEAMRDHKLDYDWVGFAADIDDTEALMRAITVRSDGPTAILAYNDLAAAHLMREANARGIRVPNDLSIIGFDNSVVCDMLTPTLSSIEAEYEYMGEFAVRHLVSDPSSPTPVRTLCRSWLVKRESTGSPMRDAAQGMFREPSR